MRRLISLLALAAILAWTVMAGAQEDGRSAGPSADAPSADGSSASDYPVARPGVGLDFPRDHGAHPRYRTEWWYVTGWLTVAEGERAGDRIGFQVTFFRTRADAAAGNPSRFSTDQILFAHAAISDPQVGRLLHDERSARQGFGIAEASTEDADVTLRDWTFRRTEDGSFETEVETEDFAFALTFDPTQAIFPQGEGGYSRKGPDPNEASFYFSLPHLDVTGTLTQEGTAVEVTGEAWLDREWASSFLAADAEGWDWTGLNLDSGAALMAFRIRGEDGGTRWAGGSFRRPDGEIVRLAPEDIAFETVRTWRSPRTDAVYPVEQILTVRLPEGERRFPLTPTFPDQELDGRSAGLPVYWEGAVETTDGRGYLELTGYASELDL